MRTLVNILAFLCGFAIISILAIGTSHASLSHIPNGALVFEQGGVNYYKQPNGGVAPAQLQQWNPQSNGYTPDGVSGGNGWYKKNNPANVLTNPPKSTNVAHRIGFPKTKLARSLGKALVPGGMGLALLGFELYDHLTQDGISEENGDIKKQLPATSTDYGNCNGPYAPFATNITATQCININVAAWNSTRPPAQHAPPPYVHCGGTYYCAGGGWSWGHIATWQKTTTVQDPPVKVPATIEDIEQSLSDANDQVVAQVLDALKNTNELDIEGTDKSQFTPQHPSYQTTPKNSTVTQTSYDAQGNPTTQTLNKQEYQTATASQTGTTVSDNSITYNITNNYTITNQNGQVVETGTEEQTPEETDEENITFQDSTMPELTDLYEQKYPDGVKGVIAAKWPQIKATSFIEGLNSFFPSFGGGSCPSFTLNLNIAPWANFGTHPVPILCWVLQACGLILLATATFTARAIIFNG